MLNKPLLPFSASRPATVTIKEIMAIRVRRKVAKAVAKVRWVRMIEISQVGLLPKYVDRAADICVSMEASGMDPNAWHAISMVTGAKCMCFHCMPSATVENLAQRVKCPSLFAARA